MTSARCPACGAAVPVGAPWCTLCYTDLRPRVPEPVAAAPAVADATAEVSTAYSVEAAPAVAVRDPLTDPLTTLDALDAPVMTQTDATTRETRGWPCHVCGTLVALEHDSCTVCGSSFLAGAEPPLKVDLPLIGDPRELTPAGRFGVMAAGAAVLTGLLVLLLLVLGQMA